ncbi:MAG: nuclear transport factor 2 family protein [Rubrivivax sp.]|nr:nuclear transport factor 2 family protein [Pyrinomonadaceae bacterium]
MKRALSSAILLLMLIPGLQAQMPGDAAELTRLLKEFLAGASRNDAAMHDRFWAEDLIYTGSSGRRVGKADIMRDVRSAPAPKPGDPTINYAAEDIRIQHYGATAIVAFRLVGTTLKDGATQVASFLNTGTFLKRDGKWQVVSWQATRMPRSVEEAKKEVAAAEAAFHRAVLAADVKALEMLTDESFILMHGGGEQVTRRQLLEQLGSGRLRYSKLETRDVTISVYGDTGVVRGVSPQQLSPSPNASGAGHATPFDAFYTLTFVNSGGAWKAVAMHASHP